MNLDHLIEHARRKGTDRQFRAWVQQQPSCVSGRYSEYPDDGTGRCVAAHVRRAGESGTGHKGEYAVVPLTFAEHHLQHQRGEAACLNRHLHMGLFTPAEAKDWFDRQRVRYLRLWVGTSIPHQ